jgi:hypothetical protein
MVTGTARAQTDPDKAAIVALVQAGLSDAPNYFTDIRGAKVNDDQYQAKISVDSSLLTNCFVWNFSTVDSAFDWILSCHSMTRSDTKDHLMAIAAADVAAALPAGFAASSRNASSDNALYQKWDGPNGLRVKVWVSSEDHGSGVYYEIAVEHASP